MQFSDFIKDKSGKFSSFRLIFIVWSLGLLLSWGYISIKKQELQKIDDSIVLLIGILTSGKVTQKYAEKETKTEENKGK